MITTRYTGEDIPIDLTLLNTDGSLIDPTSLTEITVYLVNSGGTLLSKYKEPETGGYETIEVDSSKVRVWLKASLTILLKDKKMRLEVNIQEQNTELEDGFKNTIVISEEFQIKYASVGSESCEVES